MILDFLKTNEQKRKELFAHLKANAKTATYANWRVGDRVFVINGYHDELSLNIREDSTEFIAATVIDNLGSSSLRIDFDGDGPHDWYLNGRGLIVSTQILDDYLAKNTITDIELDTSHLDLLVLEEDSKSEIIAVLKQFRHSSIIFEKWGLNDILQYGKSMSLLFYGNPGTGKTWGATCIARALGKELLVVSSSQIETSEPGGAERNIEAAFTQAKYEGKVLFFDECDSLITDRADVGMILAAQINTMLTQLEKFDGVVIFATNRADTLDPAMARRISLMVEFPMPDFVTRRKIWGTLLPEKMPLHKDVDIDKLAKFEFTGGYIKNIILNAARFAAADEAESVTKEHFAKAIKRIKKTEGIMGSHTSRRYTPVRSDYVKG